MFKKLYILILVACLTGVGGCAKVNVFERNLSFPRHQWPGNQRPSVTFTIEDTASLYHIFLVLRHTDAYNFNNLWLNVYTKGPGDTVPKKQQLDVTLATNDQGWLGSGMDDIFEHRIRITREPVSFKNAGKYEFSFEQIMWEDPLQHVLNVGLRIERAL